MIKQLLNTNPKCLYKFALNMGIKGFFAFRKYQKRLRRGEFFPAFHFISVTDDCNLKCQGCWIPGKSEKKSLSAEDLNGVIVQTKKMGSYFFGILGGEPLMYSPLLEIFQKHPDCYFQLFTNGTLLTEELAYKLRKCANVSPLISFEGDNYVADLRRGGSNVYERTLSGIKNACNAGLITGVAISVCQSNIGMALSPEFIKSLISMRVSYLWYYIYRPVGDDSCVELALSPSQIFELRKHIVDARSRYSIAIIDTYWDQNGEAFCPAAKGLSHHINPSGFIEPCPVIQFATNNIAQGSLAYTYSKSQFLEGFRREVPQQTNGCIIMEDPQWLVDFVDKYDARDTSGRDNERARLLSMPNVFSHSNCVPIPERGLLYRFAKKRAFFGLGAYG